jgi:hypothetical protein
MEAAINLAARIPVARQIRPITGEELQVKLLWDSAENSLSY